jgi:glutathione S-transferase
MEHVEIFGIPQSTYVRAVRMVCEEKSVDYELRPVLPHSPEVLAIHPFGKVPVMRHGNVALCESKAIATYLDRVFPETPVMPLEPRLAAQAEQWISLVNTVIDPTMVREYVLGYVFPKGADGKPDRKAIESVVPALKSQIQILDRAVGKTGYLVGDQFTFPDMNLMPILYNVRNFPEGREAMESAKDLTAYYHRHAARSSFQKTTPPVS